MRRFLLPIIAAMSIFALTVSESQAQVNYGFTVSRGERIDGEFNILQEGSRAGACQLQRGTPPSYNEIKIGFPFIFDGSEYWTVYINSNGFLSFGGTIDDQQNNDLSNVSLPVVAPFWDIMRIPAGRNGCDRPGIIRYANVGSDPEQILVIDFYDLALGEGCGNGIYAPVQFQVRLYQGSNRIEFYYGSMDPNGLDCHDGGTATTSASIGLATERGFLSLTPQDGSDAVGNTRVDEASIDLQGNGINQGIVYDFCPAGVYGDVDQGGSPDMISGDPLLEGRQQLVYTSQTFQPFTVLSQCSGRVSYEISGDYAAEYSIDPVDGEIDPYKGNTPTITFRPTGFGVRRATLTIRDERGYLNRRYELVGEGTPRTVYVGNVDQGGTPTLEDGDILMSEIKVRNGSSGDFTPITIQILDGDKEAPDALVTYTLIDPSGQFSIDRTEEYVRSGGTSTPVITFAPRGNVDVQSARLIVDAEGMVRTFELRPFASGPGARFFVAGEPFTNGAAMLRGVYGCVGESNFEAAFDIRAIGDEPFIIEHLNVFQVNPDITQGNPPSPIIRDAFGDPLPVTDYFLTDVSGSTTPIEFPVVLEPGEVKTFYLTFVPTRPGKRAGRTFFQTNGENFIGFDAERQDVEGMLNMEMVGHGLGGQLRDRSGNGMPKSITFPNTDVRGSSRSVGYVRNTGECDLRISRDKFRLVSGDINEFSIVSALPNSIDPATGDFVIPPGGMDSIIISFTPIRSGSRRASLRTVTNDSLVLIGGVVSRGEYYLDLFGVGNVGLEARTLTLPPAVINGSSSSGQTMLENTSGELLQIVKIEVKNGGGEILEDGTHPWPILPLTITPGQKLPLWVTLVPDPAKGPGERTAIVEVTLSNGNVLTIDVKGLVGTRTLSVSPAALFQGVKVPVGEVRRAFALVTNSGTFPVMIQSYKVTGVNKDDYTIGTISRDIVEPGETVPVDVVYAPSTQGASAAILEFVTTSTNGTPVGTHVITLGGEGTSTALGGGDPQGASVTIPTVGGSIQQSAVASVGEVKEAYLYEVVPNPVSNTATLRFVLPTAGQVNLDLYDINGRVVKKVATGLQSAGEHVLPVDLHTLPSGTYYVRLGFGENVTTQVINLVK